MNTIDEEEIDSLNIKLDEILNRLSQLNCNDSGCRFRKTKGMHTNGGCSCMKHISFQKRVRLEKLFWALGK